MLETKRLVLRPFEVEDVDDLMPVLGDADVMFHGPSVKTAAEIRGWIGQQQEIAAGNNGACLWAVLLKASSPRTNQLIGYCGLSFFPDINGRPETEIGYRLAKRFWGFGYATEAARATRDYVFQHRDEPRCISLIDPENLRSLRVAEKLGMHCVGEVTLPSYDHPDLLFAISRNEFLALDRCC